LAGTGKGAWRLESHAGELVAGRPERAAGGEPVAALRHRDALLLLPPHPLGRHAVRAGDVDEGALVLRHIGQEVEGLDGRVKGVGVEFRLRVGRGIADVAEDRLDIGERLLIERADIAVEPPPVRVGEQRALSRARRR
jgi:hypothetical protein